MMDSICHDFLLLLDCLAEGALFQPISKVYQQHVCWTATSSNPVCLLEATEMGEDPCPSFEGGLDIDFYLL